MTALIWTQDGRSFTVQLLSLLNWRSFHCGRERGDRRCLC